MKRTAIATALMAFAGTASAAADIDQLQNFTGTEAQEQFRLFSEDLGAALSYKALAPAEPLGITGFDVGVEVTSTKLVNSETFEIATGENLSALPVAKLHVHKGLPFGFDVGGFYASVPGSNVDLTGLEVRYAILEGSVATPAVAVRGTVTRLSGVDQLDFDTRGVELTVSKGFAMLTPYAGVGKVWVNSDPNDVPTIESEEFSLSKVYAGANFNMGLLNLAVEGDKTGDATSYGLKLGFRF